MWSLFPKRGFCFFICLFLLASCWYREYKAADWSFSPGMAVTEEYNSDVLFSHLGSWEDVFTRVEPKFKLIGDTEQTKFEVDSRVIGEKYYRYGHFDTVNTDNRATLQHYWTPKFSTNFSTTFKKDNILETELERAGVTGFRRDRYRYGFDLSGTYNLSDVFAVTLGGGGTFNYYPDGPYPDLDLWEINLDPTWAINMRDTLGLFLTFDYADYEGISTVQTLSNMLYWRRDLTETTFFVLGAGYRYTWSKYKFAVLELYYDPIPVFRLREKEKRREDDGFIFSLSLNNNWTDRFTTIIDAGREHYDAVDATGIDRNYIRMTLMYKLTEKTSLNCRLAYDVTEEQGTYGVDRDYVRIAPYLSWKCTQNLTFSFNGSYEYRKTDANTYDYNTDRFRGWLSISYRWPRLWANH